MLCVLMTCLHNRWLGIGKLELYSSMLSGPMTKVCRYSNIITQTEEAMKFRLTKASRYSDIIKLSSLDWQKPAGTQTSSSYLVWIDKSLQVLRHHQAIQFGLTKVCRYSDIIIHTEKAMTFGLAKVCRCSDMVIHIEQTMKFGLSKVCR